ncbi:MAG TPA: acetyl-CoA carboxylase biotin carboxyl carrier protein [Chitinophagales bacterium]|nr:acetyl-CoA carboxylase biotin carboxyl carrier protein [Chitinophagales bacterium]
MDFKQIQELIKLMGKSDLTELSIEQEQFKITLKKGGQPAVVQQAAPRAAAPELSTAQAAPVVSAEVPAPGKDEAKPAKPEKEAPENNYLTIKSPMVGTFYRAPAPDKEPFVKVGDIIRKGDHICIIEAMKLFNEIESEYDGKVVKVLVEDATPVEYDQPLFLVEPLNV